ncbi:MAG: hypothetical protein COT85_02215 [Chlamydiae bacterium CG10_big_fil_rev_8_21_14_0_10_42_34]|nr:MAG: hypothetical protein COT85_02215 [Chlamydiae bacterium CG10_big_fil_rev_8_21_14_0_10_42_34]
MSTCGCLSRLGYRLGFSDYKGRSDLYPQVELKACELESSKDKIDQKICDYIDEKDFLKFKRESLSQLMHLKVPDTVKTEKLKMIQALEEKDVNVLSDCLVSRGHLSFFFDVVTWPVRIPSRLILKACGYSPMVKKTAVNLKIQEEISFLEAVNREMNRRILKLDRSGIESVLDGLKLALISPDLEKNPYVQKYVIGKGKDFDAAPKAEKVEEKKDGGFESQIIQQLLGQICPNGIDNAISSAFATKEPRIVLFHHLTQQLSAEQKQQVHQAMGEDLVSKLFC